MALGICEGCRRFARGETCPFCGGNVGAPRPRAPGRRARSGVFAAAALAIACGGTTTPEKDASDDAVIDARDDSTAIPFYGAAPMDSGVKDASDAGTEAGDVDSGGVPLYGGAPPPDGG